MFDVQKTQCATCIYRPESPLDIDVLEEQISDGRGWFESHRQCHHTNENPACCAGFWARHKDKFQVGQLAIRLGFVNKVERDEL